VKKIKNKRQHKELLWLHNCPTPYVR